MQKTVQQKKKVQKFCSDPCRYRYHNENNMKNKKENQMNKKENQITTIIFEELFKKYPPLLTQQQYCEITGKSKSTAEQDRISGKGAPFIKIGRLVRYRLDVLIDYLVSLPLFNSTTEADYKNRMRNCNSADLN